MPTRFKVVNADLTSPFRRFPYVMSTKETHPNFDPDRGKKRSRGFYAHSTMEGCLFTNIASGRRIAECTVGGRQVELTRFNNRYEEMTIDKLLTPAEVATKAAVESTARGYNIGEALVPINPKDIVVGPINASKINALQQWKKVWAAVLQSAASTIGDAFDVETFFNVAKSVCEHTERDIFDATNKQRFNSNLVELNRNILMATVDAYTTSLFTSINDWRFITHTSGVNPFKPAIDLWKAGLVATQDGNDIWSLHDVKNKKVVWSER